MAEIGAFEAKTHFSKLLERVEKGEEIVITRRGKRIARLVPERPSHDVEAARRAMDEITEIAKGLTTGGMSLKDAINEGRP